MIVHPKSIPPRVELSKLLISEGEEERAEKLLKECLENDSNETTSRLELGKLYAKQRKFDKATFLFLECLRLNPTSIRPRLELNKIYLEEKEYRKAEQLINECLEILGNDKTATDELARQIAIINQYKTDNANLNFR